VQEEAGQREVVFAGFGGQGVLFAAELLAYAAMMEGREVAWIPSYGPEMRGGTASATVVVSGREIGSLVVSHPGVAVVLNQPSFDKYVMLLAPNGLVIYNRSLITANLVRADERAIAVAASEVAGELGNDHLANMVMLGALLAAVDMVRMDPVVEALRKLLPASKAHLLGANENALRRGALLLGSGAAA
jgi:2-oxoglutarate ferredoxin oxidoreductase subunit gamma